MRISLHINGVTIYERFEKGLHILVDAKDIDGIFILNVGRGKISTVTPNWLDYYLKDNVISVNCGNQVRT